VELLRILQVDRPKTLEKPPQKTDAKPVNTVAQGVAADIHQPIKTFSLDQYLKFRAD